MLPKGCSLCDEHRAHLRTSGLDDDTLRLAQVYSETVSKRIADLIGHSAWKHGRAMVFPFFLPGQAEPFAYRVRADKPRTVVDKGKPKQVKYEQPKDLAGMPYFPPNTRRGGGLRDRERTVFWTEGEKKSLLLDQLGYVVVGGTGTYMFHDKAIRDTEARWVLNSITREHVLVEGRTHVVVFDSDADLEFNRNVFDAARRLAGMLLDAGATEVLFVRVEAPPADKMGVDDFFVKHGEEATRAMLAKASRISPLPVEDYFTALAKLKALQGAELSERAALPNGYEVNDNGRVFKSPPPDSEAKPKLVSQSPIVLGRYVVDHASKAERLEMWFRRAGRWARVLANREDVVHQAKVVGVLGPRGAPVGSHNAQMVAEWIHDLDQANDGRLPRVLCVTRCGWHRMDERESFMAPGLVENRDVLFDDRTARDATEGLGCKGDHGAHLEALRSIFNEDLNAATMIAAALAAPLLKRLGAPSFAVHAGGDSSRGKSTMLRGAASIYGDPNNRNWLPSWNSTGVGLEVRAHTLCDLPLCLDEAGSIDDKAREASVYMLVNGVGRTRGAKLGGNRETLNWRTVVLSTGEPKLVHEGANTGAQVRVMHLPVAGIGSWGARDVDAFNATIGANYGHVGAAWLEALARIEDWPAVLRAYDDMKRQLSAAAPTTLAARQLANVALLMVTEWLAAKVLGLGDARAATMARWSTEAAVAARARSVESAFQRAFDSVVDWTESRPNSFPRLTLGTSGGKVANATSARDLHGYLEEEDEHGERVVHFIREELVKHLKSINMDESVLEDWRNRGWLRHVEGRNTRTQRINGDKKRVVTLRVGVGTGGGTHAAD